MSIRLFAALSLAATLSASTSLAQVCPEEPQLDNWTGAGNVTCPCFVAGEEAGAILQAPAAHYPIEILRVGIGWGSQFGGGPQTVEEAIHIYAGTLPNPGAPQFSAFAPQMTDGFINEFDFSGLSGNKIINSGPFTVTLEFFNTNASQLFAPSMVHDGMGCLPGKNVVFAIPGGWNDACALGVTGNWQVHVIYRRVNCGSGDIGDNYCIPAVANSTGSPAGITATGSLLASDNDVTLNAVNLPTNQFGYFITSLSQGFQANPGGSQGNICLTGNIGRFNQQVQNSGSTGSIHILIDLTQMPTNPIQPVFTGQTWNFQCWYRDFNPTPTSNFTDGLEITFQ